ncbi:MAG: hypothetical protein E6I17_01235 [Chloroflexi bacterium]|nr:MAG: hypothetical protein E6I17_01235 [Chloroflexota bacterium]
MAKRNLAELKIPATSAFIPVAKRVATTLGGQLGLSLMDLDELAIALTQACDRLAYEMIRCFVDDFRPSIEPRTGHVSFRMVKHLAG